MAVEQHLEIPVDHADHTDRCPDCGQLIRGISATRPGTHVFIDCGHEASSHLL